MVVMDAGESRFQLRAGGLIRTNGHILIHRAVGDPFWVLPGGRVEFHEAGAETLAREIEEEIGCTAVVGPLRFVLENFFELAGRRVHEVGFYYEAELARPLPFHETDIVPPCTVTEAPSWNFAGPFPNKDVLDHFDLKPLPLRSLIETMPAGVQHLVRRNAIS